MSSHRPPRWARALAHRFLPDDVVGDLQEGWAARLDALGARAASRWYVTQTLRHLGALRSRTSDSEHTHPVSTRGASPVVKGGSLVDRTRQDVRYALRGILRHPVFAGAIIVTLALAIGVTTTAFSVWEALFLRSLPVEAPHELVGLYATSPDEGALNNFRGYMPISHPTMDDVRDRAETLSGVFAFGQYSVTVTTDGTAERLDVQFVSDDYFQVLGVPIGRGRAFSPSEGVVGSPAGVAVVSHAFWRDHFDAAEDVLSRSLVVNGRSIEIVGVAPAGFHGTEANNVPAMWLPAPLFADHPSWGGFLDNRSAQFFFSVARLAPGRTLDQASQEVDRIASDLAVEHPDIYGNQGLQLVPTAAATVAPSLRGTLFGSTTAVLGLAVVVLLIACLNVAGLLIVRALSRTQEIAIRSSVGADRGRLAVQLLTETTVLFGLGGLGAVFVSVWAQDAISGIPTPLLGGNPLNVEPNLAVVAFALALTMLAALGFGLAPALRASRADVSLTLRGGTRSLGGRRSAVVRNGLVVAQLTLSIVALVGAGLFLRGLDRAGTLSVGFEAEGMGMVSVELVAAGYTPESGRVYYREVLDAVRAVPGVQSAAVGQWRPLSFSALLPVAKTAEGFADPTVRSFVRADAVTPDYLETVGLELDAGRWFRESDGEESPGVVVVNRRLSESLFGSESPIGRTLVYGPAAAEATVIGLVPTGRYVTLDEDPQPALYAPLSQMYVAEATVFARARSGELPLEAVRQAVQSVNRSVPVYEAVPARDQIAGALWNTRALAALMTGLGVAALLLVSLGVYGLVSQSVRARRREMGLRLALGAEPTQVLIATVRGVLGLVAVGATAGVGLAAVLSRPIAPQLYGVSATDPLTYVTVVMTLAVVALLSAWIPARRAAAVDPVDTLRADG